ncbi:MAG: hypothetical protein ACJ72W_19780 [Actinoallomurus sp.]
MTDVTSGHRHSLHFAAIASLSEATAERNKIIGKAVKHLIG